MYHTVSHRGDLARLVAIGGVVVLSACADISGSGSKMVSLSFTTRSSSAALSRSVGISRDIAIGPSGELVLKKIQLVLGRIEISRSDQTACADDGEDSGDDDVLSGDKKSGDALSSDKESENDDDCEDVSGDPLLVNVPVDDAIHTVVSVPLAAGTYKRLEAKLTPVDATTLTALGGPSDLSGKSVRVEGTYKGTPFVYTSPVRTKLELEFDPPLVIDGTTKNATVNIDVTKWFLTSNGGVIDPATANVGGTNADLVARNIRNSFHAFEDDDKGGDDDHEGEHGG